MSVTQIREKRQTTLPKEVFEAAELHVDDQVDWRFESGEIRGRKIVPTDACRKVKARLVKQGDRMVFVAEGIKIDPEAIGQAIAEERASR